MKERTSIHWLAPASMLGGLAAGVLFAGAHHLFYSSLDGKPVSNQFLLGSSISKQELNITIGLALAFLVKACLVFSMSVAFVQLFWREAKAPNPQHVPTLARLDSLHSVFNNILALVDVKVWLRSPLPFLIAALAWIVPIASIISPATLSIRMAAVTPSPESEMRVPNLDFGSMNFLAPMPNLKSFTDPSNMSSYAYNGPSQAVLEVSNAVMAQGRLLQIDSPAPNASWVMDFVGPSLQCSNVDAGMHQRLRQNINDGMNATEGAHLYGYVGWYPMFGWVKDDMTGSTNPMPFLSEAANGSLRFNPGDSAGTGSINNVTFYLASLPKLFGATSDMIIDAYNGPSANGSEIPDWVDGTMVQCVLFNSTYTASFDYLDGSQTITYNVTTHEELEPQGTIIGPNPANPQIDPCAEANVGAIREDQTAVCYNNRTTLRVLSYIGIMDAISGMLKGSVSVDNHQLQRNSSVLGTSLLDIEDLSFLQKAGAGEVGNNTLQAQVLSFANLDSKGLVTSKDDISTLPLHMAVEDIFQKVTISLMSSSSLQPNYSSTSAPNSFKVTLPAYRNIYTYSALKLWAVYGAAIFLAALTVLLGLVAVVLNGASYSGNFSAVFLAARGARISEKIYAQDLGGEDPLPRYLATARVFFESLPQDEKAIRYVDSRTQ